MSNSFKPQVVGQYIELYEWPQPMLEIVEKETGDHTSIRTEEDALLLIESLQRFVQAFHKYGEEA